MRCLFINTSSFFIDVAIVDNNEVLFHRVEKIDKDMSSKIMPIIKTGFSNVNFKLKHDLTKSKMKEKRTLLYQNI